MTALFNSPPTYDLPLTKGDDLNVRFVHKTPVLDGSGNPVKVDGKIQFEVANYPEGAAVKLEIDTASPKSFTATISGSAAVVHADAEDDGLDGVTKGTPWRVKIIYNSGQSNEVTRVAAHGKTVRRD